MYKRRLFKLFSIFMILIMILTSLTWSVAPVSAQNVQDGNGNGNGNGQGLNLKDKITLADKKAAAATFQAAGGTMAALITDPGTGKMIPDYFGVANWANSPALTKFMDKLAGLGPAGANGLGQYIPVAVADKVTYSPPNTTQASDYYEIAVVQYTEQLHSELPPTTLRGYVQLETPAVLAALAAQVPPVVSKHVDVGGGHFAIDNPHYLGPAIVAMGALPGQAGTPVRIKFYNLLPTGVAGDLFIPMDDTVMGAGMGPIMGEEYTQNRATLHLHGNNTVWISDGTPHQWITPAGETTYPEGVSVVDVPDMATPEPGAMTFFYSNAMSARLMFYHDHSMGITRLNVYAGEAAGYVVTDEVEQDLINGTNNSGVNPGLLQVLPDIGIPLIIQDKTFVDPATILLTDPTWGDPMQTTFGTTPGTPNAGDLWYPHIYMPAQNPWAPDGTGTNPFGRWMYGPWFYPATANVDVGPVPNPYCLPTPPAPGPYDPNATYDNSLAPWEPPYMPGTPNPSMPGEGFMDTMLINGTVYPYLEVDPKAYRFRILNAANDRFLNLQLYVAESGTVYPAGYTGPGNTEVKMIPVSGTDWLPPFDFSGVPDPATAGPDWIQIGTEGGFLPAPVVIPSQPTTWNTNPTTFNFGTVNGHSLLLGTAERADVIVDFSAYAGKTLILYNDAPAAFPAPVPTYDYYTNNEDLTAVGGAPSTQAGYGPNTRTIMQIRVMGATGPLTLNSISVTAGGSGYTQPVVDIVGAAGDPTATASVAGSVDRIALNAIGSGYTAAIVDIVGDGAGATATATISNGVITGITVTNGGSGYSSAPAVSITGDGINANASATLTITGITLAAPLAGYSAPPVVVISDLTGTGSGASASANLSNPLAPPAYDLAALQAVWAKGISPDTKRGVFEVSQDPIIIPQAAYNSAYGKTDAGPDTLPTDPAVQYIQVNQYSKTFSPIDADGNVQPSLTLPIQLKGAHDEMGGVYDTQFGRMSGMLGLEVPASDSQIAQFIPYGYASPPVDILAGSLSGSLIGTTDDGTQIWNIIHNGVDTHTIHVHLFNAQLINRVGWDGILLPPDANELGWKETFRMNPLEQIIIAMRPILPDVTQIPFLDQVPNSVRLIDPTMPEGATLTPPPPAGWFDPNGVQLAVPIVNHFVNFGWEYVYHCHLLAHEEMDMMHDLSMAVPPNAPTSLVLTMQGSKAKLTWTDNAINETGFTVQKKTGVADWTTIATLPVKAGTGTPVTFTDPTNLKTKIAYQYRVFASNSVGDNVTPGFPVVTVDSDFSNIVTITR